jgi:hypothetical protein
MIVWQGRSREQIDGRIGERQTTAQQIMSYPTNSGFVFNRRSLDNIFMPELPLYGMQKPSTNGPVASSTCVTRNPQPFQH